MAHYKTIVLGLLEEQYPSLYDRLRRERTLLATLNRHAGELREAHLAWMDELRRTSPEADPTRISSEALELAIQDLRGRLDSESPRDETEPISLDAAMNFVRRHTSPA